MQARGGVDQNQKKRPSELSGGRFLLIGSRWLQVGWAVPNNLLGRAQPTRIAPDPRPLQLTIIKMIAEEVPNLGGFVHGIVVAQLNQAAAIAF